jgi:hypothetical protein
MAVTTSTTGINMVVVTLIQLERITVSAVIWMKVNVSAAAAALGTVKLHQQQ